MFQIKLDDNEPGKYCGPDLLEARSGYDRETENPHSRDDSPHFVDQSSLHLGPFICRNLLLARKATLSQINRSVARQGNAQCHEMNIILAKGGQHGG